jgi:hypothetical protein
MQTLFAAAVVSVDEIDGALIVGFADRDDRERGPSEYLILQRGLDPDDEDGVYLEHTDQACGTYGQVSTCALSAGRLELTVDDETAERLGTDTTFAVEFTRDRSALQRLQSGLARIFSGTACRFQLPPADA